VRADKTAPDALLTATTLAKRIGKIPVVVDVCHGFVGNRMRAVRGLQGEALLKAGALPEHVDAVLTRFSFPMGPFAMGDLVGWDIGWHSRQDRGVR
jgi:3-hydroxyacyl-CoA dehydrogenase